MKDTLHESMNNIKSLTSYITEKNEQKITDEKSFREYAIAYLKKAHGDKYDEAIAKETIDGLIADKKDDEDWGALVGKLRH